MIKGSMANIKLILRYIFTYFTLCCFTAALNVSCFTTQCPCIYSTFEHVALNRPHRVWPHNVLVSIVHLNRPHRVWPQNVLVAIVHLNRLASALILRHSHTHRDWPHNVLVAIVHLNRLASWSPHRVWQHNVLVAIVHLNRLASDLIEFGHTMSSLTQ